MYQHAWISEFDRSKSAYAEAYSFNATCPRALLIVGTLQKVPMHYSQQEFDHHFFRMVQTNAGLQGLNISYRQHNIIHYTEHIVKLWHDTSSLFHLTLIDRMKCTQGRVVAQLAI